MRLGTFNHMRGMLIALLLFSVSTASLADALQLNDEQHKIIEHFRFENYDDKQMREFINQHFLMGTKKEFIDLVLIEKGGAVQIAVFKDRPEVGLSQVVYRYQYSSYYDCSRALAIPFDENNAVAGRITLHGGCL